jgi:hypothetical protein
MKIGDWVRVVWDDANTTHDEHKSEEWPDIPRVVTYGVVVRRDRRGLWVSNEQLDKAGERDTFRCTTVIPRGMIVSVEVLVAVQDTETEVVSGHTELS